MRIAIIGAGVSGLVCAHRLHASHEITVFEAADYIGGHTNTVDVPTPDGVIPVDTGFIVFNRRNYPGFTALLDELGVESAPTDMTFSVRDERAGVEWGGRRLPGLFAQRRNLVRPAFYRMLADIRSFGTRARADAEGPCRELTLGDYLSARGYSREFIDRYLIPMGAAIWSAPPAKLREFPLRSFVEFFDNHGMLTPWKAPPWRYIVGGSRRYVQALVRPFRDRIRLLSPVRSVRRPAGGGVVVTVDGAGAMAFDEAILACHSDQALRMIDDATPAERGVLGAIPYQPNEAVLHTDASLLPRKRAAWAAWNYHRGQDDERPVGVTYHMNILQRLPTSTPINVTLNTTDAIDPETVVATFHYDHPSYTHASFDAQARWEEVSGADRLHFCGAYWGWGFHEDGVQSAPRVCRRLGVGAPA